jgi:hypothetical protein
VRTRTAHTVSHRKSGISPSPSGGANKKKNVSASGNEAETMKGWRRPQRVRARSESDPAIGSVTASQTIAIPSARPVSVPERPSTWL